MATKACDGGRVLEKGDYAECVECGREVLWNYQDHWFWGFQQCRDRTRSDDAVDPVGSDAVADPQPRATGT